MVVAPAEVRKETRYIENPLVVSAAQFPDYLHQTAIKYQHTWTGAGICMSDDEAQREVASFHPASIFLLTDGREIFAQVHTAAIRVPSLIDLVRQFPTHASVRHQATEPPYPNPNFIVCFSLNCPPGYRVMHNGRETSLARALITGVPMPPGARRLAYSFVYVPPGQALMQHYIRHMYDGTLAGPVLMHEQGFGGISVAVINGSRPEHTLGGGGNVLVLHPRDEEEAHVFALMKQARRDATSIETVPVGNAVVFADTLRIEL